MQHCCHATIIILGNKFSRNIYHAKDMALLFGDYGAGSEEEEESTNNENKGSMTKKANLKTSAQSKIK